MKKKFVKTLPFILPMSTIVLISTYTFPSETVDIWKIEGHSYYNNGNFGIKSYNYSKWMTNIHDDKLLFDLSIPSTHDSAMDSGSGIAWTFGSNFARTQSLNTWDQFEAGIRGFDLRIDNDMWLRHGSTYSQIQFQNWLNSAVNFVKENPTEFIIARVKDESFDVNNRRLANQARTNYERIINSPQYNPYLFNNTGQDPDTLDYKVKNLRGKVILINNWHHNITSTNVGGFSFDKFLYRSYSLQDDYNAYPNDKERKVKEMMVKSNSDWENNQNILFMNFLSIATGTSTYPYHYASDINRRIIRYLNSNEDITKLGMVYMDFPGSSLIQAIFKRNYSFSDYELNNGILGRIIPENEIQIDDLLTYSNKITIHGQISNFKIDIVKSGNVIKTITVPELNSNTYEFNFDRNFENNETFYFKFYKETPSNQFYSSKRYNEINIEKFSRNHQHTTNTENLIRTIIEYVNSLPNHLSDLKKYISNTFINSLQEIKPFTNQNRNKYISIKAVWESFLIDFDILKEKFSLLFNKINDFKNKNNSINEIIDENLQNKISEFNNYVLNLLRSYFNQKSYTDHIDFEGLFNKIDSISKSLDYADDIIKKNKNNTFINNKNLIQKMFNNFDYVGKQKWINKINLIKSKSKEKIVSAFNQAKLGTFNLIVDNEINDLILEINNITNNLQTIINNMKSLISGIGLNTLQISFFRNKINEIIENVSAFEELSRDMTDYKNDLTNSNRLINDNERFFQENNYENVTTAKNSLINKIDLLKNKIINQSGNINPTELKKLISEINKLKEKVVEEYTIVNNAKTFISNLNEIYEEQKNYFIRLIDEDLLVSNNEINIIINDANLLNNEGFFTKIPNLQYLNNIQKSNLLEFVKENINIELIKNKYSIYKKIDEENNKLKTLYDSFEGYNSRLVFNNLTQAKKEEFINYYNDADRVLKNGVSLEEISIAYSNLSKFKFLNNSELENDINELITKINNTENIYLFEKVPLINEIIENTSNLEKLEHYKTIVDEKIENNQPLKDLNIYENLNQIQKEYLKNSLFDSLNLVELNDKKNEAETINQLMLNAINIKNNNANYFTEEWFIENNEESKDFFRNAYTLFSNKINEISFDKKIINDTIEEFLNSINLTKQNSLIYINERNINNAKNEFNKIKDEINNILLEFENESDYSLLKEYLDSIRNQVDLLKNTSKNSTNHIEILKLKDDLILIRDQIKNKVNEIRIKNNEENERLLNEFLQNIENVYYAINNKNKLPSWVINNELIINNLPDGYKILNLSLNSNDDLGILNISYEISNNKFTYTKTQKIIDFMTLDQINLENEKRIFNEESEKIDYSVLNKEKLPSNVNDFLVTNLKEGFTTEIIERTNNDSIGEIHLTVTIRKNSFSKTKNFILKGFLTTSQVDFTNKLNKEKEKFNEIINSFNKLIINSKEHENYHDFVDYLNEIETCMLPNIEIVRNSKDIDEIKKISLQSLNKIEEVKSEINKLLELAEKNRYDLFDKEANTIVYLIKNKNQLPSEVDGSQIVVKYLPNYLNSNITKIERDDQAGIFKISFEISNNKYKKQREVSLTGFKTRDINVVIKQINDKREEFDKKYKEFLDLILTLDNSKHFETVKFYKDRLNIEKEEVYSNQANLISINRSIDALKDLQNNFLIKKKEIIKKDIEEEKLKQEEEKKNEIEKSKQKTKNILMYTLIPIASLSVLGIVIWLTIYLIKKNKK
ncbi:1-phosphatidylinositol phosphodiesterase precursor [Mycoplasmopsis maculosa]|uniref:1-phosphatidylinositol phosphodiesterase n=1 Tax=Mycoplasmopsis maculosa TaxID=114885 RepID=A0A449B466_9BACT|nr:lipoprotein 17-related variable surface protein [Mycoplasmopsis maculosa]VEU75365.1 1-phosphatidylinositol phosphodiesterase precursor [Mycoplasmopsis maculosa]